MLEKRKRLEAKGWTIGGAAELLGLSREEEAFVEIRLRLAQGLKRRRLRQRVTRRSWPESRKPENE